MILNHVHGNDYGVDGSLIWWMHRHCHTAKGTAVVD